MTVVQINATCGIGSTGKICVGISKAMTANEIENYILFSSKTNGYPLGKACSEDRYIKVQALKSRILGNYGFNSKKVTKKMIDCLEKIQPDIVHLHNIHGHDCDIELLFLYFKEKKIKLVWTFHDCWAFTGYCPHFSMVKCDKWKTGCFDCIQRKNHSWIFDKSSELFKKKQHLFSGLDLTIVTPSAWLADMVKQSFLNDYPVKVINNGIDLDVFKPTESGFRSKYNLENKKIVLGVAFDWGERKGLDVFVELSKRLPHKKYQIVLIGTDKAVDSLLPLDIISINRTNNQMELAEIYTAADVFVNPTREDTFPTVNIESLACGTPVITFDVGGSPEIIDEHSGRVVECDNIDALEKEIVAVCQKGSGLFQKCIVRSEFYDSRKKYQEYIDLYIGGV